MVAALPAGWLADNYRRDYILKGAAALGKVAGATLALTLLNKLPVAYLCVACGLLGSYTGFNNAPLEALFADCAPRGKRSVRVIHHCCLCVQDQPLCRWVLQRTWLCKTSLMNIGFCIQPAAAAVKSVPISHAALNMRIMLCLASCTALTT